MKTILKVLEVLCLAAAAGLWFASAKVHIPPIGAMFGGEHPDLRSALDRQATMNALAATFAGLGLVLQIIQYIPAIDRRK